MTVDTFHSIFVAKIVHTDALVVVFPVCFLCYCISRLLMLSNSVRKDYTVGEVVNFMNVDANRIAQATFFLHNLWSAPLNIMGEH